MGPMNVQIDSFSSGGRPSTVSVVSAPDASTFASLMHQSSRRRMPLFSQCRLSSQHQPPLSSALSHQCARVLQPMVEPTSSCPVPPFDLNSQNWPELPTPCLFVPPVLGSGSNSPTMRRSVN